MDFPVLSYGILINATFLIRRITIFLNIKSHTQGSELDLENNNSKSQCFSIFEISPEQYINTHAQTEEPNMVENIKTLWDYVSRTGIHTHTQKAGQIAFNTFVYKTF